MQKVKVLFVCMGNICRSPTAEGVFQKYVDDEGLSHLIEIDSAGTTSYHSGEPPDRRASEAALSRGFDLSSQRSRAVKVDDFYNFDYILAMDNSNLNNLINVMPNDSKVKPELFLKYSEKFSETEVPDPYYGGAGGFEHVLDLVEDASAGLIRVLKSQLS